MRKIKYLLALAALLLCVPALAAETPRLKIEVPGQNVKPQEEFADAQPARYPQHCGARLPHQLR